MGVGVVESPRTHDTEASEVALSPLSGLSISPTDEVSAARFFEKVLGRVVLCDQQSCSPAEVIGKMLEPSIRETLDAWRASLEQRFSQFGADRQLDDQEARRCFEEGDIIGRIVTLWESVRDIEASLPNPAEPTAHALLSARVVALQKLLILLSPEDRGDVALDAPAGIGAVLERESALISEKLVLSSRSPLSGALSSPLVNSFLHELVESAEQLVAHPEGLHELRFERSRIEAVRQEADGCLRESERSLRCLAGLVAAKLIGDVSIAVEINGKDVSDSQRCLVAEAAGGDAHRSLRAPDDPMAPRIISYRPKHGADIRAEGWVEEVRTRCKAPQSLLNKLVDRMFGLHSSTPNDFSRYLKDVRGMSLIVRSEDDVRNISRVMHSLTFRDDELARFGVEPTAATRSVVTFETKDRLTSGSAWRGIKFILVWNGSCTEVQIKTRDFFEKERKSDTTEAHGAHKERQQTARRFFADRSGLGEVMSFYRSLVEHTLYGSGEMPAPLPSVRLIVDD